jgi:hypothetical protein
VAVFGLLPAQFLDLGLQHRVLSVLRLQGGHVLTQGYELQLTPNRASIGTRL